MIRLLGKITDSINQNKFTIGAFVDLSKAFITVDQVIFIKKLPVY